MQVAQGTSQTDSSGTRQATLFFQPGTTATMTLPDGSTQTLSSGHVRATEYSVGANGPSALPGTLPTTDAYAYSVNFRFDEAQQVGATNVQFNKPVISYTPNFLSWPVGLVLPSLYLDHKTGHWVDGPTGRVIKILSVTAGKADLDVDGTGTAATAATLAALGVTDAELQQLATTYAVGQSLWRVPLNHFTDYDF
jgi:hypothetical protein